MTKTPSSSPLNPDEPYYEWELEPDGLLIYSECCADAFSPSESIILLRALAEHHGYELKELKP